MEGKNREGLGMRIREMHTYALLTNYIALYLLQVPGHEACEAVEQPWMMLCSISFIKIQFFRVYNAIATFIQVPVVLLLTNQMQISFFEQPSHEKVKSTFDWSIAT